MTGDVIDEAAWLGEDNEIVRRSRARERAGQDPDGSSVTEHRVVGPPGCGKTTWLARQANIAAGKYGSDAVMLASLTRTAAKEIAGRETAIPDRMIGTLHSHCFRALERPALAEIPDGIREWNAWAAEQGLPAVWQMQTTGSASDLDHAPAEERAGKTEGDQLRAMAANLRARMIDPQLVDERTGGFASRWEEFKTDRGRLDFTDLIEQAIARHTPAPGDPAVIMLDEAQDMSRLEMTLARQWAAGAEQLVIVSDPAQALYTWRGSDPEAIFSHPAASETVLEQSYRVPAAVHSYAVDWIRQMPGHRDFAYRPTSEPGEVRWSTRGSWQDPDPVIESVHEDLQAGLSVMVLATCGFMLQPLVDALKRDGTPFHNPYRPQHGGWNPLAGAGRLLAYLRPDGTTWGDEARMWTHGDLHRWMDPLKARGLLSRGAKTWLQSKNLEDRFGESSADATPDPGVVAKLFASEDDAMTAFDMDVDWWQANQMDSRAAQARFPCQVYRTRGGAALREQPRLTVGTVHSVKGGEADSVYLWPDLSQAAYEAEWANPQRRAPVYRTLYVGMTRARQRLTILPPSGGTYAPLPVPAVSGARANGEA